MVTFEYISKSIWSFLALLYISFFIYLLKFEHMDTEEEEKITTEVRTHRKGRPNKNI